MTNPKQEFTVIEQGDAVAVVTPMQLVQLAVQQGADIDKLEKLLELQMRWEADQARKAFVVALNAFKADAPKIIKTKEVSYGQGKTAYKHALAGVASEVIGAALAVHGISHRWDVQQEAAGKIKVTCILTHAQGHSERVSLEATPDTSGSKNSIQAIGSTVSYLQRYSLFAATGLVPLDADTDGHVGGKKEMAEGQRLDFEAAIGELTDKAGAEALWKKITAATSEIGDVATHDDLRAKLFAKAKGLK